MQIGLLSTQPHKKCKSGLLMQKINLLSKKTPVKMSLEAVPSQNIFFFDSKYCKAFIISGILIVYAMYLHLRLEK